MKLKIFRLLAFIPIIYSSFSIDIKANRSSLSEDDLYGNFLSYISSYYELDTVCTIPYNNSGYEYIIKANIVDKISETSRYNNYDLNITYDNYYYEVASGEFFYSEDNEGYTIENYISTLNTIEERSIYDVDGNEVKFLGNYNSPFYYLSKLNKNTIKNYFDLESSDNSYILTLNESGYSLIEESFNNFFNRFTYKYIANFDSKTHDCEIKNIKVTLNSLGTPTLLTFNRVESDFYGALIESFSSSFIKLDSIPSLEKVNSTLSIKEESYFNERIEQLNTSGFNKGNFTQVVNVKDYVPDDTYTYLIYEDYTYNNYYDESNYIMLSDYEAYDATYGTTYIGTYYYSDSYSSSSAYTIIGISPSEGFYSSLSSSYPTFESISECAPTLDISSDFFTYKESGDKKIYTFDISNFYYADYYFSLDILEAILGQSDPSVILGAFVSDSSYNFNFKSLVYSFDKDDNLTISLTYEGYYGYDCVFSTYYTDLGTTNIVTVSESNSSVKDCLTILNSSD